MNELLVLENLIAMLRKGSWTLEGDEILAFHQAFQYLVERHKELKAPKVSEPIQIKKPKRKKPSDTQPIGKP